MPTAIVLTLTDATVTARGINAPATNARLQSATLVDVHFAQVALVSRVAAVACEIVNSIDATAAIQTRFLGAFVDVHFAVVTTEPFGAFTNVALKDSNWTLNLILKELI